MDKLILWLFIISGFLAYLLIANQKKRDDSDLQESLKEAGKLISEKKERSLKKIMDLLEKTGRIRNDDVQDLLDIADSTATRYLDELEIQGKIIQCGESGRGVYYTKK